MRPRLLITGASGFLGQHLVACASSRWTVTGSSRQLPDKPSCEWISQNLCAENGIGQLLAASQPDAVIHAAAESNPNHCETQTLVTNAINVSATTLLAKQCAASNIRFCFTSTDLVFDGSRGQYRESDATRPLPIYGQQKRRAELEALACHPGALICRLPLMFGAKGSFLAPLLSALRSGETVRRFDDEFRSPASATQVALALLQLLDLKHSGIIHLGGPERISRYAFGLRVAATWQLPPEHIVATYAATIPMPAPRPADVSLCSARATALGIQQPPLQAQLNALRSQA